MTLLRTCLATVLLLSATAAGIAKVRTPTADDELQAACYPDVQRLCKDAIPDEGKITVCMEGKRSMISARCLKAYETSRS